MPRRCPASTFAARAAHPWGEVQWGAGPQRRPRHPLRKFHPNLHEPNPPHPSRAGRSFVSPGRRRPGRCLAEASFPAAQARGGERARRPDPSGNGPALRGHDRTGGYQPYLFCTAQGTLFCQAQAGPLKSPVPHQAQAGPATCASARPFPGTRAGPGSTGRMRRSTTTFSSRAAGCSAPTARSSCSTPS